MRTRYSNDQQAIAAAFAALFERESPVESVRAAEDGCGFDKRLWDKLAAAGAPGMALPEALGGGDASLVDLAVVAYEWGRRVAAVPLIEHAVACRLLARTGAAQRETTLRLASGELIGTVALRGLDRGGVARLTPAGAVADVVIAMSDGVLVAARSAPPGAAIPNTGSLPLADRDLSGAAVVASGGQAEQAWRRARAEWMALTAVAYGGLGQEALDMGVAYVKQRHQFGVPVGSFQAVQHGLADAATRLEGARLLAFRAVCTLERLAGIGAGAPAGVEIEPEAEAEAGGAGDEARRLASMALLFAADAVRFVTDRALHYHGGYGYSAEYDIQLYYRRAAAWLLQLGAPGDEISRLADAEFGPSGSGSG